MDDELITLLQEAGAALVGYADMSEVPEEARQGLPRAVSIALALNPRIIADISDGPTEEYLALYHSANAQLDDMATRAAAWLEEHGHRAVALKASSGADPVNHTTPLPNKTAATRSGLGWIGKCALLVTPEYGAAVRLNTVLTDAPLPVGEPINASRCGDCTACVEVCPGGAPSGREWRLGLYRDEFFDAQACRRGALETAAKAGIGRVLCGLCIAHCPWTRRYLRRAGAI